MQKKGFKVQGFKYGGNTLGGLAIVPDNGPYSASTRAVPIQYQRATNGMMQNGGYLDYTGLNPILSQMQNGGTTNYNPVNQNNANVEFINDKRGYNTMQTPGQHYTNDGFKKSTGSTMNGQSWSKFGGNPFQQFMPTPNEYAYLQQGGYIDKYNTGGQAEQGGFATNGPMIYDETPEMKDGGIHINSRPFYRNGGIVEGEYDIDEPLTMDEIKHLKSQGYDVHY